MTSPNTPIRTRFVCSFDRFEDAEQAQALLLAAGLPAGAVMLHVIEDEAGPTEGNFVSGNGRAERSSPPDAVITGGVVPYDQNFARIVSRGVCMLRVQARDPQQHRRVQEVLRAFTARGAAALIDHQASPGQPT